MSTKGIDRFTIPLNRPEYPGVPEAFQSALAWSLMDSRDGRGYVFKRLAASTGTVDILETCPRSDTDIERWKQELDCQLVFGDSVDEKQLALSLLSSIEAVRPARAKSVAALPLVPSAPFLQNSVGLQGKSGPPDFGVIINQMYNAGARRPCSIRMASTAWYKALSRNETQPLFTVLDRALSEFIPIGELPSVPSESETAITLPVWLRNANTPFKWFHDSWNSFCSEEWRESLPRRRWSDWASCLLRTGIGMGYLWEAWFYQSLARLLLEPQAEHLEDKVKRLLQNPEPLITWRNADYSLTTRDVNVKIRRIATDGIEVRAFLDEFIKDHHEEIPDIADDAERGWLGNNGLSLLLGWLHESMSEEDRKQLRGKLGLQPRRAVQNTIETITYSLQCRQEHGMDADYYGLLLRRSKRFLVVEPGLEWIVVITSMACQHPGGKTTLKSVRNACKKLGMAFERNTLIAELERAGLTHSSHDADDAIVVWSGFD